MIDNPMNLTTAELRREYGKALATVAKQADQIADLRAEASNRYLIEQTAEKNREIERQKELVLKQTLLGSGFATRALASESREAALLAELAEERDDRESTSEALDTALKLNVAYRQEIETLKKQIADSMALRNMLMERLEASQDFDKLHADGTIAALSETGRDTEAGAGQMRDHTYAVDIWWLTGNSSRTEEGVPYRVAMNAVMNCRKNKAIARVEVVKMVKTETTVKSWNRKQKRAAASSCRVEEES